MRIDLDQADIEAIANRVIEQIIPLIKSWQEPDELMDINQVCQLLKKSKGQIYQWVHSASHGLSDFPYHKAGRSLRFSQKDILKWLKSRKKRLENG
ncbi:MAG: helix-turn-helix domain-containing protein [Syntrophales bacterium]